MRNTGPAFLRSCGGCSAHIVGDDSSTQTVYCPTCQPKHVTPFDQWAASVKPDSLVYLQPYAAWRGLSHSRYLVVDRDGDELTVQVLGVPESRMTVDICHAGQHDLTPLAQRGAPW